MRVSSVPTEFRIRNFGIDRNVPLHLSGQFPPAGVGVEHRAISIPLLGACDSVPPI